MMCSWCEVCSELAGTPHVVTRHTLTETSPIVTWRTQLWMLMMMTRMSTMLTGLLLKLNPVSQLGTSLGKVLSRTLQQLACFCVIIESSSLLSCVYVTADRLSAYDHTICCAFAYKVSTHTTDTSFEKLPYTFPSEPPLPKI